MNYVILNGNDSRNINGLLIQSLPPITKPAMRTEVEEIDGRDGDIITPLGYSAYNKTVKIGLYGDYDVDEVIGFFNTSGTVIFSNEPEKVYSFQALDQFDFERLIRFKTADIVFHVQPFKFSLVESPLTFTTKEISGEGASVTLSPTTAGGVLNSFKMYGNAAQSGTPTTAAPVPIQTVKGLNTVRFINADGSQSSGVGIHNIPELCKLGTYQDYIYLDGGTWYKRATIAKRTVDTNSITAITSYSNIAYASIPKPTDSAQYGNYKDIPCLCTHAVYSYGLPAGWNTAEGVNKIFAQADNNNFWLGFPAGTTLAQMKAALSGCVIYYPLLLPNNVAVTAAADLNAVLNLGLFDGSTIITSDQTSGNAQAILSVSALQEAFTVTNIGNIYSRPAVTIYGSGIITVSVNGQQLFTVDMNSEDFITIDGAAMEAFNDNGLKNRLVTGNYDNFIFKVGANYIVFSGDVNKAVVSNYSRWI